MKKSKARPIYLCRAPVCHPDGIVGVATTSNMDTLGDELKDWSGPSLTHGDLVIAGPSETSSRPLVYVFNQATSRIDCTDPLLMGKVLRFWEKGQYKDAFCHRDMPYHGFYPCPDLPGKYTTPLLCRLGFDVCETLLKNMVLDSRESELKDIKEGFRIVHNKTLKTTDFDQRELDGILPSPTRNFHSSGHLYDTLVWLVAMVRDILVNPRHGSRSLIAALDRRFSLGSWYKSPYLPLSLVICQLQHLDSPHLAILEI